MPLVFQIPAESPLVDRFQWSFWIRLTRKKVLATCFQKISHDKPMNSRGALSDIALEDERMAQNDQSGFCSAVRGVTRSQNRLHGTSNDNKSYFHFFPIVESPAVNILVQVP